MREKAKYNHDPDVMEIALSVLASSGKERWFKNIINYADKYDERLVDICAMAASGRLNFEEET